MCSNSKGVYVITKIFNKLWILPILILINTPACKKRTAKEKILNNDSALQMTTEEPEKTEELKTDTVTETKVTCATGDWNGSVCITCPENTSWDSKSMTCMGTGISGDKIQCTTGNWNGSKCIVCPDSAPWDATALGCAGVGINSQTANCTTGNWNGSSCILCPSNAPWSSTTLTCVGSGIASNTVSCTTGNWNGRSCVTCPSTATWNATTKTCTVSSTSSGTIACTTGNWNGTSCVTCPSSATWNATTKTCTVSTSSAGQNVCTTGNWDGTTCITCPSIATWNTTTKVCDITASVSGKVVCAPQSFWNGTNCITCPLNSIMNQAATGCIGGTILGVFYANDPAKILGVGVRTQRGVYHDTVLRDAFATNPIASELAKLEKIKTYYNAGIKIIATLRWKESPLPQPGSSLYNEYLQLWEKFLIGYGPYLHAVTLENELIEPYALSDLGMNADKSWKGDTSPPAIDWLRILASKAGTIKRNNPKLSHLLIGTPGIDRLHNNTNPYVNFIYEAFFPWATQDPNIDFIDIHAHVQNLSELHTVLSNVTKANTGKKMLASTEWSQARQVEPWLDKPVASSVPNPRGFAKNIDYLTDSYINKLDLNTWNALVATIGYDPNFIKDAFNAFKAAGYHAVYFGAYTQLGLIHFDTTDIYADKTVVRSATGAIQPNYLILQWFTDLSSSLQTP